MVQPVPHVETKDTIGRGVCCPINFFTR